MNVCPTGALYRKEKDGMVLVRSDVCIGHNPKARLAATNLEYLGRLGNCHAGIGSNFAIGGNVLAPNHIDAMYRDAVVYFDGKAVLDNGVCKI
jgi:hypothetical protein